MEGSLHAGQVRGGAPGPARRRHDLRVEGGDVGLEPLPLGPGARHRGDGRLLGA